MATLYQGYVSDKITLTTTAESYLSVRNPPPSRTGTYTIFIQNFTVTSGIKFNVGKPDVDLAASSGASVGGGDEKKLVFTIRPGTHDLLMKAGNNNDSFEYFLVAND